MTNTVTEQTFVDSYGQILTVGATSKTIYFKQPCNQVQVQFDEENLNIGNITFYFSAQDLKGMFSLLEQLGKELWSDFTLDITADKDMEFERKRLNGLNTFCNTQESQIKGKLTLLSGDLHFENFSDPETLFQFNVDQEQDFIYFMWLLSKDKNHSTIGDFLNFSQNLVNEII